MLVQSELLIYERIKVSLLTFLKLNDHDKD